MNTHLQKPKNVYQFRRRIPGELQQILGRKEIVESLRTLDYEEAKRLGNMRAVETDAEFAAARAQLAKGIKVEVPNNARAKRLPFDLPALKALFSSPVHAQGERPKGGAGEAAYRPRRNLQQFWVGPS